MVGHSTSTDHSEYAGMEPGMAEGCPPISKVNKPREITGCPQSSFKGSGMLISEGGAPSPTEDGLKAAD